MRADTWKLISPDLTRNDPSTLKSSGGPITQDNTSVEYYGTIFAAIESPYEENLLWTGSDDGLIHVSKDGGDSWENVTPKGIPKWLMINSIDAIPEADGGVYVAGTAYKSGDYQPYIYKTTDYGKSWQKLTDGIPNDHFVRVVRVDPVKPSLLYAGSESGIYVSCNSGKNWQPLQLNMPIVPITDLTLKDNHLIAATQGRGFWVLDDLTVLHQAQQSEGKPHYVYAPKPTYRIGGRSRESKTAGTNMPSGVITYYYLQDTAQVDTVRIEYKQSNGELIQAYSNHPDKEKDEKELEIKPGANQLIWDMQYPGAKGFEGMILWWASLNGPTALPGQYSVLLSVDGQELTQPFEIVKDPRSTASQSDLQAQFDFQQSVVSKLTETNKAVEKIGEVRKQIEDVLKKTETDTIKAYGKSLLADMKAIEEALYQTKNKSGQDPLNFPIRLNNKLGHLNSLASMGDNAPTASAIAFKEEVTAEIDEHLTKWDELLNEEVKKLNLLIKENEVEAIKTD